MKQSLSFGLLLQQLSIERRVLVAGSVAAARSEDTAFTAAEAQSIFDKVWVPRPGNIHDRLVALEREHLVRRASRKSYWGITPQGREVVRNLLEHVDSAAIEIEFRGTFGSDFAHVRHTLVPPSFAPVKWLKPIARLTDEFPFERNVFVMTRFPLDQADTHYLDPIRDIIPVIRAALAAHGLVLHVASQRQLDDDVLGNVAAHMWACNYGIGILEDRIQRGLNYNVITELGAMLMTGRRCALLKDSTAPNLPTDLVGQIYKPVDVRNAKQIDNVIHQWASADLGLGTCTRCIGSAPID